jgi:WD repeat-containing protein 35
MIIVVFCVGKKKGKLDVGNMVDDELFRVACNEMGEYYADRQKWCVGMDEDVLYFCLLFCRKQAISFFRESHNTQRLIQCFFLTEDFDSLKDLIETLPAKDPLLLEIGNMFTSVGIADKVFFFFSIFYVLFFKALVALTKHGDVQTMLDACVRLNQWDRAISLAQERGIGKIETLLQRYADYLLERKNTPQAIELFIFLPSLLYFFFWYSYHSAGKHLEAARLLSELAQNSRRKGDSPMRIKRIYVLAGMEIEAYRDKCV